MPETIGIVEEHSEDNNSLQVEVQELLGHPPGWLLYSGISIVFVFVFLLGLLSWFIKYPDKLEAPVLIESSKPPVDIISPGFHIIDTLLIEEGQWVQTGQVLAIMENPAKFSDIQELLQWLENSPILAADKLDEFAELSNHFQLGALQNSYAQLLQLLEDIRYYQLQEDASAQIASLDREIKQIDELMNTVNGQKALFGLELELKAKELERTRKLKTMGAVSVEDLESKEAEWIRMQRQLKEMESSQVQNQIRIEQLRAQQMQIGQGRKHMINEKMIAIRQQVKQLAAELDQWKAQFLILAPIAGKLSLAPQLVIKKTVHAQELLFTILPTLDTGGIIARCEVPVQGIGKLSVGTPLLIYLDAYPYKEFGILETAISEMAQVPQKNKENQLLYHIVAPLSDTLTTSYQKAIPFRQKLSGRAVLISEDKRIFHRVFDQLRSLMLNQS